MSKPKRDQLSLFDEPVAEPGAMAPLLTTSHQGEITVIEGDCVEEMAKMPENSIDAIVTDPPYGLEFMGKEWDRLGDIGQGKAGFSKGAPAEKGVRGEIKALPSYNTSGNVRCRVCNRWKWGHKTGDSGGGGLGCACASPDFPHVKAIQGKQMQVWHHAWATEALRVLKPGGHMLVFGGTRTYHRMTCGVEDAGFEIRDCLQWLYGSGFPKSHNLTGDWQGFGTALKPAYESIIVAAKPDPLGERAIIAESLSRLEARLWSLLPAKTVVEHFTSSQREYDAACGFAQWSAGEKDSTLVALSGLMDTSQFVTAMTSCLNIVRSWNDIWEELSADTSTSTIAMESETTTVSRTLKSLLSGTSPLSIIQAATQADGWSFSASPVARVFSAVGARLSALRTLSATESAISQAASICQGEGANLSPACEPIVLARKPLVGTVAANVLEHGTGALNIDGTRIAHNEPIKEMKAQEKVNSIIQQSGRYENTTELKAGGRWPANVILDEKAAAILDKQSGARGGAGQSSGPTLRGEFKSNSMGDKKGLPEGVNTPFYGDTGGASRFFYTAKASRAERGTGNDHPTVKPIELMRWLVRLITPPGGIVLDPFAGSGSTLIAASREGFASTGIEKEASYAAIIRDRMEKERRSL